MSDDRIIRSEKDLEQMVEDWGIVPFFANEIPGFSLEEHCDPELWFSGKEGPWEWKGPVIRGTGCAYGKFLEGKAVYISKKMFPDFANYRRDGYDFDARFDDELAPYQDKQFFDLLEEHAPVTSKEFKKLGNYGKGGKKGYETILTRLMSQGYILTSDIVYARRKDGRPYGWGIAQLDTPEHFMGEDFTSKVYDKEPEESYALVLEHLCKLFPEEDPKNFERMLKKNTAPGKPNQTREWLIPVNLKYYDLIGAYEDSDEIIWKQGNDNMKVGDLVYMYVGAPYSAILYKTQITEANIPYDGRNDKVNVRKTMSIKKLDAYPPEMLKLEELKKYDVRTVRGPRFMPQDLMDDIEKGTLR